MAHHTAKKKALIQANFSLEIPDNQRSPSTDCLGTSKCKTAANKSTPLTFLKRSCLPGNRALPFFFLLQRETA